MKKIIVFALVLAMMICMAVTAYAFTPKIVIPHINMPDIHTEDIEVKVPYSFLEKWFPEIHLK